MGRAFDILGLVFGALGVVGIVQLLCSIIYDQLPSQKFRVLDEVLKDADALFISGVEEGLLSNPQEVETRLRGLRLLAEDLRVKVYSATTMRSQCWEMLCGLSRRIELLCSQAKALRASILSTTEHERRQRDQQLGTLAPTEPYPCQTQVLLPTPMPDAECAVLAGPPDMLPCATTTEDTVSPTPYPESDVHTQGVTFPHPHEEEIGPDSPIDVPRLRRLSTESTSTLATIVGSPSMYPLKIEDDPSTKPYVSIDLPRPSISEPLEPLTLAIAHARSPRIESPHDHPFSDMVAGRNRPITQPPTPIQPNYEISPEVVHQVQLGLAALVTVIHALQTNLNKSDNILGHPSLSRPSTPTVPTPGGTLHPGNAFCHYHLSLQASSFRKLAAQSMAAAIPGLLPSSSAATISVTDSTTVLTT